MVTTQDPTHMEGEQGPSRSGLLAALVAFALFMLIAIGSWAAYQRAGGAAALEGKPPDIVVLMPGKNTKDVNGRIEMASFSHNSGYTSRTTDFKHAEVVAIMGHSRLDLTGTQLAESGASIEAIALCGAAEIKVPADWTVRSKDKTILLGAVRNSAGGTAEGAEKVVRLEAVAVMGRVEVTH